MDSFPKRLLHFVSNLILESSLRPVQVRICVSTYVNECCKFECGHPVVIVLNNLFYK